MPDLFAKIWARLAIGWVPKCDGQNFNHRLAYAKIQV
jgi:hypothetical protein